MNRSILLCIYLQVQVLGLMLASTPINASESLKTIPRTDARYAHSHPAWASDDGGSDKPAETDAGIKGSDPGEFSRFKGLLGESMLESDGIDSSVWRFEEIFPLSHRFAPKLRLLRKESKPAYFLSRPWENEEFEPTRRLSEIKLTKELNSFSLGTLYRHVDEDFKDPARYRNLLDIRNELKTDQEKIDFWAAKRVGLFQVKGFYSRAWDNVAEDPERFQMLDSSGSAQINFKTPELPVWLSFSYKKKFSESTIEPEGSNPRERIQDSFSGSFYYYGGRAFEMTLSSIYSPGRNSLHPEEDEIFWHEVRADFRPLWYLTITPTLSYGDYRYPSYGERTENPFASLLITYSGLLDSVDLSFWGSYSEMRGTLEYQDEAMINTAVAITWIPAPDRSPDWNIGLKFAGGRYIDHTDDNVYDDFSTILTIESPF